MAITIRKLEVFLEVAAQSSFGRAAEQLGISQPSVSVHIAELEADLGFALFERRPGARPRLTDRGHLFFKQARDLVSSHAELCGVDNGATGGRSKFVVALGATILALIRSDLSEIIVRHPNVDIEFETVMQIEGVLRAMDDRQIDAALYTGPLLQRSDYPAEIISQVSYSILAPPDLAQKWAKSTAEGAALPVVLPSAGMWPAEHVQDMLRNAGFTSLQVMARSQFPDVLISMALNGVGAIVMPDHTLNDHIQEGRLAYLREGIGGGYRCILLGPKAQRPPGSAIIEDIKRLVLARQTDLRGGGPLSEPLSALGAAPFAAAPVATRP